MALDLVKGRRSRSRRMALLSAALIAVASTVFVASGLSANSASCLPKTTTIGGKHAVVFCGPAKVTARAAGKTFSFKSGSCVRQGSSFFLQMGTIGGPTAKSGLQRTPLFYLLTDTKTCSTTQAILYWIVDGKRYGAAPGSRVTFTASGKGGSFSGPLARGPQYTGNGPLTGTFTC